VINNENKIVLQILELCNKYLWDEEACKAVYYYAKENGISERDILEYAKYYSAETIKNASEELYGIT
jgi:hypothetical protein